MSPRIALIARLRAYRRIVLLLVVLAWFLLRLLIISAILGGHEERAFRYRRKFTRAAIRVLGVELEVHGRPSDIPALYVGNHRSLLDPIIQLSQIDAYIVAKAEVAGYPVVGRGARETGVVFVQRESKESRSVSRDAIRRLLQEGKSVLIYPEGTTSNMPETLPFKIGSFEIAAELGVPVVPVMIDYADSAHYWHGIPMLPFFIRKFSSKRINAALHIGPSSYMDDALQAMEYTRSWIGERILEVRQRVPQQG